MNDEQTLESQIVAGGCTAPRVTPDDIENCIISQYFFTAGQGVDGAMTASKTPTYCYEKSLDVLTFCVLVLRNGFTVTGESACASPKNFDAQIGQRIARDNAREKIWLLEGYLLKEKLSLGQ